MSIHPVSYYRFDGMLAEKIAQKNRPKAGQSDQSTGFQGEAHELRWFLLPSEARDLLRKNKLFENLKKSPFIVRKSIPKVINPEM